MFAKVAAEDYELEKAVYSLVDQCADDLMIIYLLYVGCREK
jgi:hypothetical protein